ncbi:hypothetical protein KTO58_19735 [Chitinophaga pendula]|uniref:hypothetical protein n=1 Tax=Chitinophaga TaxID=79328 RepID=UPI000BAF06FD|nr:MULTISPECIES: hypothetical protein [Chitinophaga]ASZ11100.1 hypothetical protein CK934_09065 [Chitinophaga sp. MD30]UCJ05902.1 hypothetical protein KTO58_19735 [Chitinophaga pendula]
MDKYARLANLLKSNQQTGTNIFTAAVISVQGESCTVDVSGTVVSDVRLKATVNEAANRLLIVPVVGSYVLVASLSGDMRDLAVISVDEVEQINFTGKNINIEINDTTGKIDLHNKSVGLTGLIDSLFDLLKQNYRLATSTGPTGTPLPDSITALNKLQTDFKRILK